MGADNEYQPLAGVLTTPCNEQSCLRQLQYYLHHSINYTFLIIIILLMPFLNFNTGWTVLSNMSH